MLDRDHRPGHRRGRRADRRGPGARRGEDDEATREHGIQVLAQMLVGAVQSLANWWADHRRRCRAQRIVEMMMDFAWLGLAAAQPGRALARLAARELRRATSSTPPTRGGWRWSRVTRDGERREIELRRGRRPLGAARRHAGARGVEPRRRRHDADRQPARVGLRDGGLLAARGGGPALHRAAAPGRPARAHGRGRPARDRGGRAQRRAASARRASTGPCWSCRTSGCSRPSRRRRPSSTPRTRR